VRDGAGMSTIPWPEVNIDMESAMILCGYMGSQSHGTYIPDKNGGIDDKDVMGICVPPIAYYFGLKKFEQYQGFVGEYDFVLYEFKKYMGLLLKCNPNVMGLLWLDDNMYITRTALGTILIENRDIFSSKLSYKSFTGYAYSQLASMEKWNVNGYLGAKRKALIEKHGYDTKNAAHLIRLLRMGIEFLSTGRLNVFREDAQQLMAIKKGEYSLERIQHMAEQLFHTAELALINSKLPDEPDYAKAEFIMIHILQKRHEQIPT
jgi:uncharacterized protein